ncbi:MAG: amino acid ABC transporter substrate-binding protein [Candidatus Delongbacteria bacterium]|nr:amino acid ABC transporter substrate-binding protein [Candidatus Delongbacteria bacterium]MBN2836012.1 amino acid ABC transporter substrate-binding protein [Candidatus Delongbacteria bacterium]
MKLMRGLLYVILLLAVTGVYGKEIKLLTLENPPLEYKDNGVAKGFNVELVTEVLKRMGHTANIEIMPWKRALSYTANGKADGVIDAGKNAEREKDFYFPEESIYTEDIYLFKTKNRYLVLEDNLSNAGKLEIGINRGFFYGGIIQEALDNNKFKKVEEVSTYSDNVKKLMAGRFDALVGNKLNVEYAAKAENYSSDIEIVKDKSGNQYKLSTNNTYVAFSKQTMDQAFADAFSKALKEVKADGTYENLKTKYFK